MTAHKVFICYSSQDEAKGRILLEFIEARALKCWISSRDVLPGHNYQESIVEAIQNAGVVVFLFSDSSNKTSEVRKELSLASTFDVPVIPVRLSSSALNPALRYELATRQWIDAFSRLEDALPQVVAAIRETLQETDAAEKPKQAAAAVSCPWVAPGSVEGLQAPIVRSGSDAFEAVRALLARHVGPIAKVFVQKAAADARSVDEFCERLAAHVPATADRAAFLRAVRVRISAGS